MIAAGAAFAAVRITPWAGAGVIAALAANWFGDSLDGTVARVRDQQRPRYGFYVDHVIDLAGTACSDGRARMLRADERRSWRRRCSRRYLLVAAESYLATHAAGVFRISFAGIGPTELRIVLAMGAVAMIVASGGERSVRCRRCGCSTSAASSPPRRSSSCSRRRRCATRGALPGGAASPPRGVRGMRSTASAWAAVAVLVLGGALRDRCRRAQAGDDRGVESVRERRRGAAPAPASGSANVALHSAGRRRRPPFRPA